MTGLEGADLQRWSEDVARDPASMSFLPLAQAYRRQGRRSAALSLCLRGLEQHPAHVDAHALLALLYLESGDRQLACDEWSTVLRLEPENFDAHRGLGFVALERDDLAEARRHLERAAELRPDDPSVRGALDLLTYREESAGPGRPAARRDPARVFEPLASDAAFGGALILDAQGLVQAGSLVEGGPSRGEALGAKLSPVVEEVVRTVSVLGLGRWAGLQLEADQLSLGIAPVSADRLVLVAGSPDGPAGWLRHATAQAVELARGYVGEAT